MSCVSAGCQKASLCDTNEQQNFVRSVDGDNFFLFSEKKKHFFLFLLKVKKQVFERAQAECLRCYLISSSKRFKSIKLSCLAEKFEIQDSKIVQLCSQFIAAKDFRQFRASLDIPGGYLIIHEHLPTQFETSENVFHRQVI